jgi:hypothetical protein
MTKRIAVIGIHGVGEHEPGATARAIAWQLQQTNPAAYPAFRETPLSISVDTTALGTLETSGGPRRSGHWLIRALGHPVTIVTGYGSAFTRRHFSERRQREDPLDVEFSRSLLADGQHHTATYGTTKLEGAAPVDVFELYWSDLSHVGSGSFAIFEQFFQLLIHMASLGRTAAAMLLAKQHGRVWHGFYHLNALSYWLLSMPIVIGNLILALLGGFLAPALLSAGWLMPSIGVLAGLMAAALVGIVSLGGRSDRTLRRPATPGVVLLAILVGLIAGGIAPSVFWALDLSPPMAIAIQRLVLAGVLMAPLFLVGDRLIRRYDVVREGALALWRVMVVALVLFTAVATILLRRPWPSIETDGCADYASLLLNLLGHAVEAPFAILLVCWVLLYFAAFGVCAVGLCLRLRHPAYAAEIGTSRLAVSLPAPFFLGIVLAAWSFVFHKLPSDALLAAKFTPWCSFLFGTTGTASAFVTGLITKSGSFFVTYLAVTLVAAILVLAATLPSVYFEVLPPDQQQVRTRTLAAALGAWLDDGFGLAGGAGWLAALGFVLIMPVGILVAFFPHFLPFTDPASVYDAINTVGVVAGGSALGFAAATQAIAKTFANALGRLRIPLDTALDVDNWLRERPAGATVRLRIFARFASLLRHLEALGYGGIVVVAHSQGTVVASEFLRYLRYDGEARFKQQLPPIRLLTMGAPLRQLYAARFGTLYRWAAAQDALAPQVAEWANAYCSGDYIGRWLWNDTDSRWQPGSYAPDAAPDEFCVGAGAHTHYFDADNAKIGTCIDGLIERSLAAP